MEDCRSGFWQPRLHVACLPCKVLLLLWELPLSLWKVEGSFLKSLQEGSVRVLAFGIRGLCYGMKRQEAGNFARTGRSAHPELADGFARRDSLPVLLLLHQWGNSIILER